jgi:hypothetical protein
MPKTCIPRHAAPLGAVPTDPTLLGRMRKRRWQEGGTHRNVSLVSAESELGTLPVSKFELRSLQNRSGLGRSAVLRRTHTNHVPLSVPAHCIPIGWGGPLSTPYSHRLPEVHYETTATALLPHRPRSMPKTCIPRHAAPLGAVPTDPTLLGRTRKRRWQEGGTHR